MTPPFRFAMAAAFVALVVGAPALGQVQSKDQGNCIKAMNKGAVKVGQAQGGTNVKCLKDAGKGKLAGSAQDCLTADTKNKVGTQMQKTLEAEAKKCSVAPDYAYSDGATVNGSAVEGRLRTFADLFGANLDATLVDCDADGAACKCQQIVAKATENVAKAKWKEFLKCKKKSLGDAVSASDLSACVDNPLKDGSIAADSKQKVAKQVDKLTEKIGKKCDDEGATATAFPGGACAGLSGAALSACIDRQVECRVCQAINDADSFDVDCDLFDDAVANVSCDCSHQLPDPNLQAAITKQIVSIEEPPTLTIELVTLTAMPFQLDAVGLTFPAGFDLLSLDSACTAIADNFRCAHTAVLEAAGACQGDGDYELSLQYNCSPTVLNCAVCLAPATIDFVLDTEFFCAPPTETPTPIP